MCSSNDVGEFFEAITKGTLLSGVFRKIHMFITFTGENELGRKTSIHCSSPGMIRCGTMVCVEVDGNAKFCI